MYNIATAIWWTAMKFLRGYMISWTASPLKQHNIVYQEDSGTQVLDGLPRKLVQTFVMFVECCGLEVLSDSREIAARQHMYIFTKSPRCHANSISHCWIDNWWLLWTWDVWCHPTGIISSGKSSIERYILKHGVRGFDISSLVRLTAGFGRTWAVIFFSLWSNRLIKSTSWC